MSGMNEVLARNTEKAPMNDYSSQTVAFSHYNHFSAQLPVTTSGQLVEGCVKDQARQVLTNIKEVVESIDHVMTDVVRLTVMVKNILDVDAIDSVIKEFFPIYVPSRTVVAVAELPLEGALVQMDVVISNGEGTIPNAPQAGDLIKLTNSTHNAPMHAVSTQTVAFSHYNNVASQLPIDPKTGRLVVGDVKEQTVQALKNLKAILESIDVVIDDVVKINLFVTDLANVETINEVYTTFFPDSGIARAVNYLPARTVVPVEALEMGALVAVEAVVSHGDGTPPQLIEDRHGLIIEANNTDQAPVSKYSTQSVAFSHYNNISGQLPVNAEGALVSGDIKEQTAQVMDYIKAIIESVEHSMDDIVKINMYLTNIADAEAAIEVYNTYFENSKPALRVVGVSELPHNAKVMIDAVAGNAEGTPPVK